MSFFISQSAYIMGRADRKFGKNSKYTVVISAPAIGENGTSSLLFRSVYSSSAIVAARSVARSIVGALPIGIHSRVFVLSAVYVHSYHLSRDYIDQNKRSHSLLKTGRIAIQSYLQDPSSPFLQQFLLFSQAEEGQII